MSTVTPRKAKFEYSNAKSSILVGLVLCGIGLLLVWLLPGISWVGWIFFGVSAFGVVGWTITLVTLRKKL